MNNFIVNFITNLITLNATWAGIINIYSKETTLIQFFSENIGLVVLVIINGLGSIFLLQIFMSSISFGIQRELIEKIKI